LILVGRDGEIVSGEVILDPETIRARSQSPRPGPRLKSANDDAAAHGVTKRPGNHERVRRFRRGGVECRCVFLGTHACAGPRQIGDAEGLVRELLD